MKKYALIIGIIALLSGGGIAYANSSIITGTAQTSGTSLATTTAAIIYAGTGTTTLAYDAYSLPAGATNRAFDTAELLVQYGATSTAPALNINIEYSQDGIDWYQNTGTNVDGYATTTTLYDVSQVPQYKWIYATSTAGLGINSNTTATTTRALAIQTPTRFIRAIFTVPVGAGGGSIWAQWVPKRQAIQ